MLTQTENEEMLKTPSSLLELSWDETKQKQPRLLDNCNYCGRTHLTNEHWHYMEDMPQEPIGLMDDLVKMGLYRQEVKDLAHYNGARGVKRSPVCGTNGRR